MKARHFLTLSGFAACCLLATGCEKEDPDHLASVARKVAARAEPLVTPIGESWKQHWHDASGTDESGLEKRVAFRLRWEQALADLPIQVVATEKGVELRGKVNDEEQKKRAVEVAKATTGVERVTDALEVEPASP